ncbi:hypothetical protein DF3PA_290008 [Candidatus Defluviicoccus seviourii]|uniref:Uncharacterized protein n=1 Tax=Candidatus Defluviicoccus seviourii TaxID=2565273 RepID=A0A564WGV4_9PROT|nr:hypothetical protein DF3PA_290008 [Candidatus Defluviicoccus seviourii]
MLNYRRFTNVNRRYWLMGSSNSKNSLKDAFANIKKTNHAHALVSRIPENTGSTGVPP